MKKLCTGKYKTPAGWSGRTRVERKLGQRVRRAHIRQEPVVPGRKPDAGYSVTLSASWQWIRGVGRMGGNAAATTRDDERIDGRWHRT